MRFWNVFKKASRTDFMSALPLSAICASKSGMTLKYGVPTAMQSRCASVPACPSHSVITGRPMNTAFGLTPVSIDKARRAGGILNRPEKNHSTTVAAA